MSKFFQNIFIRYFLLILIIIGLHYLTFLKPIENSLTFVLSPAQNPFFYLSTSLKKSLTTDLNIEKLTEQNKILTYKIQKLENSIIALKTLIADKKIIEEQNLYLSAFNYNYLNAQVIVRGNNLNPNILIINKGSRHGIKNNMAIVGENGYVVGKIFKTEKEKSYLRLLIDNQSTLNVALPENFETIGLIVGKHNLSIKLINLLKNSSLSTGDLLITSGLDENIPAGLKVGEVDKIEKNKNEIFNSASILSQINFKNIRVVSIILN